MASGIGVNLARQKQKFRQQFGVDVTVGARVLRMRTRSLEKREHEYLPQGMENAADADLRVFEASPADFWPPADFIGPAGAAVCQAAPFPARPGAGLAAWPAVDSLLTWHGVSYTLLAVHPGDDEVGGVMITLLLFVYKTPPSDSQTTETAAEAAASGMPAQTGKRKQY